MSIPEKQLDSLLHIVAPAGRWTALPARCPAKDAGRVRISSNKNLHGPAAQLKVALEAFTYASSSGRIFLRVLSWKYAH